MFSYFLQMAFDQVVLIGPALPTGFGFWIFFIVALLVKVISRPCGPFSDVRPTGQSRRPVSDS